MLDILMLVHTMGTMDPSDNDRFSYIANLLVKKGHSVEMVTSDFEHHKKCYRDINRIKEKYGFKVTFIHENRYSKNVSIGRIAGHISFARRLKKYLFGRKKPDVIYCAVPPIISANVMAKYAKQNGIRFVTDVQDLWPESFEIALGKNLLSRILLAPLFGIVNDVYQKSDAIIAVSETYAERALMGDSVKPHAVVFLGTDSTLVDAAMEKNVTCIKAENGFDVGYIGNIGASYDFLHVFQALGILSQKGYNNITFHVFGDGNYRKQTEELATQYFVNTKFYGYLPYSEMISLCKLCDIVLNPIIAGTSSSVVNKVGDYAAMGLPVVNTQDNPEYRKLVEQYRCGLNTEPENSESIAEAVEMLYLSQDLRQEMGHNNRCLYEERFDRSKTYSEIMKLIEGV